MSDENIIIPFVQLIYYKQLNELENKKNDFINRCLELEHQYPKNHDWLCDTYSTLKTEYVLKNDVVFKTLISNVVDSVIDLSKRYQINNNELLLDSAWVNIYKPNDYQEYHLHNGSQFSAVYYVDVPENSGAIVFQNKFEHECMKSLEVKNPTQANSCTYWLIPKSGDLVIFRSNTPHMVTKNKSNNNRISIAMNFSFR